MTLFLFRFAGDCQARTFSCSLASKPTTIASTVRITSLQHQGTCGTVRGIVPGHAQHQGQQTLQEPPSRQAQGVVQLVRCSAPHSQSGPPLGCKPGRWRRGRGSGEGWGGGGANSGRTPFVVMNCYPPKSAAESGQRARAKMRFIYMISLLIS